MASAPELIINNSSVICLPDRYPYEYKCMICLDDIDEDNLIKMCETNCVHQFHIDCLQQWKSYNNSCPYCKQCICDVYPLRFRTEEQYVQLQGTLKVEYSHFPSNHSQITMLREELSTSIMKINNIEIENQFINFADESTNDFAETLCKYINTINSFRNSGLSVDEYFEFKKR